MIHECVCEQNRGKRRRAEGGSPRTLHSLSGRLQKLLRPRRVSVSQDPGQALLQVHTHTHTRLYLYLLRVEVQILYIAVFEQMVRRSNI